MDQKTIYWLKTQLTNDEDASDEEMRAYFIEGGLAKAQADEWIAKRSFYRHNIVMEDDDRNDIGIYDPNTRSIKPLAARQGAGEETLAKKKTRYCATSSASPLEES